MTCNCNKLRELKRNIELRHQANECLANGKIIYTQNPDSLSIVKIEGFANQVKVWNSEAEFSHGKMSHSVFFRIQKE